MLPGGAPLVTVYNLDKVTATELVQSSEGVSGRQESKYQREKVR